ncbi:diguanylate cyclase [Devosia sp. Root685]|uniref:diguanylate cyclase n=1 Tax=Devosia sp. Root685 TaxID=1736587 RepID=UPI0006FC3020|nr:diguanylate cyclase [Devosia sp. Root685]KRA99561.1 diguanylate cyclase [Devosia sp. Root685]
MRISTITNLAYVLTVGLTLLSGGSFIIATHYADRERDALDLAWKVDESVEGLGRAAELTTEDARLYVFTGEPRYLDRFQAALSEERERERAVRLLREKGLPDEELAALRTIEADAEILDAIEEAAVSDFTNGAADQARAALFSPEHEEAQLGLLSSVRQFVDLVSARTRGQVEQASTQAGFWGTVAKSTLALTALVFLCVLYFVLTRRVTRPLLRMSDVVRRLARQDYDVQLLAHGRRDEIGDMNEAIQVFRDNGLERERLDAERRQDQQTKDQILQLMHRLQACRQEGELAPVVSLFASQLFPDLSGHLFVMNTGRTALSAKSSWGTPTLSGEEFSTLECWGIRRGRAHLSDGANSDVRCLHLAERDESSALCVPLSARGDTVGVLYFEEADGSAALGKARTYVELIAENLALAIANLQLRDRLANLAVRDPLTGLLNRRSLDENLADLMKGDKDDPASLMMIDIDHFKRFNDQFGHDAGDYVMGQVAAIITNVAGQAGITHRYGGEEFAVIFREQDGTAALQKAEAIRHAIETAPIDYQGQPLGAVTVSIGVATTEDNRPKATLMQRADAALLEAKSSGRNVVVCDWSGRANRRLA